MHSAIVVESTLKEKPRICPVMSIMSAVQTAAVGGPVRPLIMKCHGSECMVWRWIESPPAHVEQRKGYCGLAGLPATE